MKFTKEQMQKTLQLFLSYLKIIYYLCRLNIGLKRISSQLKTYYGFVAYKKFWPNSGLN